MSGSESHHCAYAAGLLQTHRLITRYVLHLALALQDTFCHPLHQVIDRLDCCAAVITCILSGTCRVS